MPQIAQFDVYPVDFDRHGQVVDASKATLDALCAQVRGGAVTDLLIVSHGWNNDKQEADELYTELLGSMGAVLQAGPLSLGARRLAVLTVHWPSKKFADKDLIPGGAAGVLDATDEINAQIDGLMPLFADDPDRLRTLQQLRQLTAQIEHDPNAADDFGRLLRSLFPPSVNEEEEVLPQEFFTTDGLELLERLARPFRVRSSASGGAAVVQLGGTAPSAAGGGAGLGNLFQGIKNGAQNLLNLFTYYEMKERAGLVGRRGLCSVLKQLKAALPAGGTPPRIHYAGHSFGGRLVTAALACADNPWPAHSVCLLQAAFSHWGFATKFDGQKNGLFQQGVSKERLVGPMLITHTPNDRAVGLAYPIASRFARQVASGLGDANDPYGGIGRNGAQKTPEVDPQEAVLRPVGALYTGLKPGRVSNLEASQFITGHSDVRGQPVAQAILSAIVCVP